MIENDFEALNRRLEDLQAIERRILAIEGLHKQLIAAFELFAFGSDNGRLGVVVAIRAVISYFSERSPLLAAQGLLNPLKHVADALEELEAGLVLPILTKPGARRPKSKIPPNVLVFRGGVSAMVDALLHCPDPLLDVDGACAKVGRKLQSIGYQVGRQDSSSAGVIENWRKHASKGNRDTDLDAHFYRRLTKMLNGSPESWQSVYDGIAWALPGICPPRSLKS